MPAGGTLLTSIFGGSLLTEFVRFAVAVLRANWLLFVSDDSGSISMGPVPANSVSECRIVIFVDSVWVEPLFRSTASSSGSLIATISISVLFASCKLAMDVMESRLLLLPPVLSFSSYFYKFKY